jgi:hypothetical protein
MDEFRSNKYTGDEVTRIIRRALEMKREEAVTHQDLLQTAEELGLDPDTLEAAIQEERTEFKKKAAIKKRMHRRKSSFRRHLWSYIIVNSGMFLINAVTPGPWWFQWPLLGWGIGLAFNFRAAYFPASPYRDHR